MPCTTHAGPAPTAKRQERSGTTAHGAGASPGYFHNHGPGSARRSAQPSLPRSPRLGDNVLPGFSIAARRSNTFILAASVSSNTHRPPALPPPASAPRHIPAQSQHRGCQYLHGRSSPSLQLRSASAIPPGDGGPGLRSTAAVPPSWETASINRRHIHPSPDLGMAIPRLGLSPGNAACQPAEPGGRAEGGRGRTRCGKERAEEPGRSFCTEVWPGVLWISPGCSGSSQRHGG